MNYYWNWRSFREMSPDGVHTYLDTLMAGTVWTLATALTAWVIALALALLVGTARTLPHRVLAGAAKYPCGRSPCLSCRSAASEDRRQAHPSLHDELKKAEIEQADRGCAGRISLRHGDRWRPR